MNQPITPFPKIEYAAAIEDVLMKLSIDRAAGSKNMLAALTKHTHAYSELFVCLDGRLTLEVKDMMITLDSGDAAIVPATLSHHKLACETEPVWCALGFLITANRRGSLSRLSARLAPFEGGPDPRIMRNVPDFCEKIHTLCTRPSAPNDCVPAIEFALLLLQYADRLDDSSRPTAAMPHDSSMNRIAMLENLVNTEFMTDITPHAVAALLHISTRQLSRIVQKRFGMTFTRVIIHKRLETAAKLLTETDRTVDAIAQAVGFSSTAFMHHEFKKTYLMTPIEYRNSRRKQDQNTASAEKESI